jgi:CheY-like chemotaxis protein
MNGRESDWLECDNERESSRTHRTLSILVVEDNTDSAYLLARLLEHAGHSVVGAATLGEARIAAEHQHFDILISDLALPDGSGRDLVRELQRRAALPAIAVSGYGGQTEQDRSIAAGFARHLLKPVPIESLLTAIDEVYRGAAPVSHLHAGSVAFPVAP